MFTSVIVLNVPSAFTFTFAFTPPFSSLPASRFSAFSSAFLSTALAAFRTLSGALSRGFFCGSLSFCGSCPFCWSLRLPSTFRCWFLRGRSFRSGSWLLRRWFLGRRLCRRCVVCHVGQTSPKWCSSDRAGKDALLKVWFLTTRIIPKYTLNENNRQLAH